MSELVVTKFTEEIIFSSQFKEILKRAITERACRLLAVPEETLDWEQVLQKVYITIDDPYKLLEIHLRNKPYEHAAFPFPARPNPVPFDIRSCCHLYRPGPSRMFTLSILKK